MMNTYMQDLERRIPDKDSLKIVNLHAPAADAPAIPRKSWRRIWHP